MQDSEGLRRWRLILGGGEADGTGVSLQGEAVGLDQALSALYDGERGAGLGGSAPRVTRWLGDIRRYFPTPVVQLLQRDALERLNLRQMLLEPELLASVTPDVHLAATLVGLKGVMPERAKATAREVVQRVVDEVVRRLAAPTRQAVLGSLNRASRNARPRHHEIDWSRTIRANLRHYQPRYRTIIPERRIGFGRRRNSLCDVIICVDQSGSMATSVVYSGIFSAVLASIPAVTTRMVVFDTAVVDLSDQLGDPVELLFGLQLGGGTDINQALVYCQQLVQRPHETVLILISDLYEGGDAVAMVRRASELVAAGVQCIALLALSDEGAPAYAHHHAASLAGLGIATFACTPDQFPGLLAAALARQDLNQWAAREGIVTTRPEEVSVQG